MSVRVYLSVCLSLSAKCNTQLSIWMSVSCFKNLLKFVVPRILVTCFNLCKNNCPQVLPGGLDTGPAPSPPVPALQTSNTDKSAVLPRAWLFAFLTLYLQGRRLHIDQQSRAGVTARKHIRSCPREINWLLCCKDVL